MGFNNALCDDDDIIVATLSRQTVRCMYVGIAYGGTHKQEITNAYNEHTRTQFSEKGY